MAVDDLRLENTDLDSLIDSRLDNSSKGYYNGAVIVIVTQERRAVAHITGPTGNYTVQCLLPVSGSVSWQTLWQFVLNQYSMRLMQEALNYKAFLQQEGRYHVN
jgi:hypothetical protein